MWETIPDTERDGDLPAVLTTPLSTECTLRSSTDVVLGEQCFLYEPHPVVNEVILANIWTRHYTAGATTGAATRMESTGLSSEEAPTRSRRW